MTDVCLILEGTYPYVRGGVSSWVHRLIAGMPQVSFSLLSISPDRKAASERQYELPPNVRTFAEVFIHELVNDPGRRCPARERREAWRTVKQFHLERGELRLEKATALLDAMGHPDRRSLGIAEAVFSKKSWDFVVDRYKALADGTSFIDYFWTWRAVHAPLFQTLIAEIPPARVYHAISTGYAGLLGVLAKRRTGRPFVLTEHGIYVRERTIDISRADWIYEEPVRVKVIRPGLNPLKEMWSQFFVTLGKLAYDACDLIITLYGGNQDLQHELGADPRRTRVISNGVETDIYAPLVEQREAYRPRPLRVGFVGRVVPIKDVKTLLKSFALVARDLPEVEFWVVGPTDEDEVYFQECKDLVETLGLRTVTFTGSRNVKEIYPAIDVMVLTSISEGQPLTILEAACAGVPSVATDVGSCRELIEGRVPEDRALGPSGLVTEVGAADQTAAAIVSILSDDPLRARMSKAGMERTASFYRQSQVIDAYRELYERYRAA